MQSFACPHCGVEVSLDEMSPGELVACGGCSGHFRVPQSSAASTEEKSEDSSHTLERARRQRSKKMNPVFFALLAAGGLLGSGAGIAIAYAMFSGAEPTVVTREKTYRPDRGADGSQKMLNPRRAVDPDQYRPKGPRLSMTRNEFRDRVAQLDHLLDPNTGDRAFVSGKSWHEAFGDPHRVRMSGRIQCLYWNCSDGTLHVACEPSSKPLQERNSSDGSELIVKRINDEFY